MGSTPCPFLLHSEFVSYWGIYCGVEDNPKSCYIVVAQAEFGFNNEVNCSMELALFPIVNIMSDYSGEVPPLLCCVLASYFSNIYYNVWARL